MEARLADEDLADLGRLVRTLAAVTQSARVKAACLTVIKAARARRSRAHRTRRPALALPYYGEALTESANIAPITWISGPDSETR